MRGGEDAVGHVVRALDLGLQVPLGVATGVLLLRRRASGYLLGGIFLAMAVCMGGALTAMVAWRAVVAGESIAQATPFGMAWAIGAALAIAYFRVPGTARAHGAS